jgi:UDP-N-acetylglucosamine 1-carboxyvinyltransferase
MSQTTTPADIGRLIKETRHQLGLTQDQLAERLRTSQSAIHRIEAGNQNLSLEMINRLADALSSPIIVPSTATGPAHFRIGGPSHLSGSIATRSSKNAAVALLCASLINNGRTVLRGIARIAEVDRICEVLVSIGMVVTWSDDKKDLTIEHPGELDLADMDEEAARKTRSILMVLGPLMHQFTDFQIPFAGGCTLGARTVEPHLQALRHFGLEVEASDGAYHCHVAPVSSGTRHIVLTERGDTVTENTLLAAALAPGETVIRNASPNYMVQDLCFFLTALGVGIEGIGTTTLRVTGLEHIARDTEYDISEDPIESMSLLTAAVVTGSELTVTRCPIEFLEIELSVLGESMGLDYGVTAEYPSANGQTRLVDITVRPSRLRAPRDKIHPMPFPGLNIDNLPFFVVIALTAEGETMIHDWVYEDRTIHMLPLANLGADVKLLDPHRLKVTGPTKWHARDMFAPQALRPAVCAMLAMLAGDGTSVLRDVYPITRGYEDLPQRLNALGADVEVFHG